MLSLKLLLINGDMISGELSPKLQELSVISEVIEQDDFEMSEKRYTIYKGTLSNGSEIAVVSTTMSADNWMDISENQFKLKIPTLSKINHKNFMNLLGYYNDDDYFTRMLVVEYAPNGTLFEHLHIKEAEQLDWSARLRIAMGIIYCLEYLESINPPARVKTLNSYTIYLSEDYAAKVSDIGFGVDTKIDPFVTDDPNGLDEEEPIVYKYAVLLLELISGKLPFSADTGLLVLWASSYLTGKRSLMEMVDPTLDDSISEEFLMALCEVVRACINPNTEERPSVAEVAKQMKEISRLSPEAAIPRDSPLWWAELEILSTEGS